MSCLERLKPSACNWERKRPWFRYWRWAKRRVQDARHRSHHHYAEQGIELRITHQQVGYLWKRDKAWLLKRPSLDRKNPKYHYTVRNCRFIEFVENSGRANRKTTKETTHARPEPQARQVSAAAGAQSDHPLP